MVKQSLTLFLGAERNVEVGDGFGHAAGREPVADRCGEGAGLCFAGGQVGENATQAFCNRSGIGLACHAGGQDFRNAAHGDSFTIYDGSEVRATLTTRLKAREITLPRLPDWLVELLNRENLTITAALTHPAFGKLFLETEYLPVSSALLCHRRPRSPSEAPIWDVELRDTILARYTFTASRHGVYVYARAPR